jgi:hypothetical protein
MEKEDNFVHVLHYEDVWQSVGIHSVIHGAEPFLRSRQLCSYPRTSYHFMEPEGSYQISPIHTIPSYLSKIHFNIVHPLRLGLPSGLFPSGFPTNILYAYHFSPFLLHALPISSSLT